ncbi:TonB-dependent receptor [Sphingobium sp. 3R8]|uniref:TonB-dependent receptor n=1 Tax=Sphingobium sp. 3R8 TaxID=2874921 RepID=UPI001CCD4FA7|nr:TonB-dependent receptor [Sphingobium sp. 3R8]MBZ9647281.1 TonB-dependent receptor [Sphingobium sp. 3R8]
MRARTPSLALLLASLATPAAADSLAEPFWPDHARFALKPRLILRVQPAPPAPPQRQARIYAIELAPSPADPADLRLALQRRRQRFGGLPLVRAAQSPGADMQPRSSVMLADARVDLPSEMLPWGDRLSATLGWQAVKISNRAVNATSPYTRDDLRARDGFLPSARLALAATSRLDLRADYRETIRAYADSGTIGALGLDQPGFRALRAALRPERDSLSRIGLRWAAVPALRLAIDAYDGQVRNRLSFVDHGYLPRTMGSAQAHGVAIEAVHSLSPTLQWRLRYDLARMDVEHGERRTETRLAVRGEWRRGPWRGALSAARTSAPFWAEPGHRLRIEGGIDYMPDDLFGVRLGLHLADPDRLAVTRLADQPQSGPVRAADQARALMFTAALRL